MTRWIVPGAALVLVAAVGVTVWLFTESDKSKTEFSSLYEALTSRCHAFTYMEPVGDNRAQRDGKFTVFWRAADSETRVAQVQRTASGKYRVLNCHGKFSVHG